MFFSSFDIFRRYPKYKAYEDLKTLAHCTVETRNFDLDFPKSTGKRKVRFADFFRRLYRVTESNSITVDNLQQVVQKMKKDVHFDDIISYESFPISDDGIMDRYIFPLFDAMVKDCEHLQKCMHDRGMKDELMVFGETRHYTVPEISKYFQETPDSFNPFRNFRMSSCKEKLDYLKRCRWSAYDPKDRNKMTTFELHGNAPFHIKEGDIVRKVQEVGECCKDTLPNLYALKRIIDEQAPKGILRLTEWKEDDGTYRAHEDILIERYSPAIIDAIGKDVQQSECVEDNIVGSQHCKNKA